MIFIVWGHSPVSSFVVHVGDQYSYNCYGQPSDPPTSNFDYGYACVFGCGFVGLDFCFLCLRSVRLRVRARVYVLTCYCVFSLLVCVLFDVSRPRLILLCLCVCMCGGRCVGLCASVSCAWG